MSMIRPRQAEAFEANCLASNEVSVATVNKWARTLKSIFTRAIDPRGYLAEGQNPFSKIKERKITERPIRYVDLLEYSALMDASTKLSYLLTKTSSLNVLFISSAILPDLPQSIALSTQ